MDTTAWLVVAAVAALITLVLAAVLLVRVFKARKLLVDSGIPLRSKALVWAAVIYTVSPVDLLPDPVYLDDIGFLLVALRSLHSAASAAGVRTGQRAEAPTGTPVEMKTL
ncbi:YkvA family protein [Streptomyces sp. C11-1]|uniref:YkvA family protein n=1 Tax=Streptomyces durocortorensis TaxID=2811104 RepID=A0ABY9VV07_9ACTN|nr:YkvA family protein [Streptomyces durocortorensis]WNF25592.1 YkvA family protein [Streptomyces durocortorensis]